MCDATCLCCGTTMGENWPGFTTRRGRICMGCEGAEISVYAVTINGSCLYDKDPESVLEVLKSELASMDDGDSFHVGNRKMSALRYFDAPEHQGF